LRGAVPGDTLVVPLCEGRLRLPLNSPEGARMKITYSQIEVEVRESIDKECAHHIEKLNRLLKRYDPDLVQLHCTVEKTPHRIEFAFSLNLTLPTGSLQATGYGSDARAGAKVAFAEIEGQVKKHQEKLRKDYIWKRKRPRGALKPGEVTSAD
jgi:ribosomal subunit interface protein